MRTWAVWQERLRILHGKNTIPARLDIEWGDVLLSDFREARAALNLGEVQKSKVPRVRWSKSGPHKLKLDVTALINELSGDYSVGGIVRNSEGQALLAFATRISKPQSIIYGDLVAVHKGICLVQDRGMEIHEITTDSLLAVQAVTKPVDNVSYTGDIAMTIRCRLDYFPGLKLIYVPRSANVIAHELALFALSSPSLCIWESGNFPFWLVNLVLNDVSLS
ncbi:uncharacterized protein [Henckelia pumila]|uniref:uncharacterized protein n=1 Tax=Henckelia pumila TaxID=405737 RepID=UPI003C6E12AF